MVKIDFKSLVDNGRDNKMEWNLVDMIEEYKGSDFSKRLNLYLQYPDARAEFTAVDRSELKQKTPHRQHKSTSCLVIRTGGLFSLAAWRIKRVLGIA